jgi:hypothetical protein
MGYGGTGGAGFLNPGGAWGTTASMGGTTGGMGSFNTTPALDESLIPKGNPSNFFGAQWENLGPTGQATAILGAGAGLMSLLGRRQGPSRYEVEREGLGRGLMSASDAYSGQLGSLGAMLQGRGLHDMDRYRSQYMDEMTNPNNNIYDMAQLASQDAARQRGISQRVGLTGGGLRSAQLSTAAYNPAVAGGISGILSNWRARRAGAFGQGAQWGQQDFGQGLGLGNQAYGVHNAGVTGMMSNLQSLQAAADARRAASDQAMMGAVKGIGSMASGGIG